MTRTEIFELIVRRAREVLPDLEWHAFTDADSLEALGANSLDRAEIVTLVLESLSARLARIELFGPRNIGELTDLIHGRMQGSAATCLAISS